MNTLQIRCRFDKSDIIDSTFFSFFGRGALTAFIMILSPFALGIVPTIIAVLGAFHLNFNIYLTLYVISYWAWVYVQYRAIFKNYSYKGVHEIYFTDFGIETYTPMQYNRIPVSEITGFEEGKKMFLVLAKNNKTLTIPKRYMTLDEGMIIRNLFSQFYKKRGNFNDSFFKGERLEEAARTAPEEITGEFVIAATDEYLKDAAWCKILTPIVISYYLYMFFMLSGIFSSLGDIIGIVFALGFTLFGFLSQRKKMMDQLRNVLINSAGCIKVIFCGSYFEVGYGNETLKINYRDIIKVKDFPYSVKVHTKYGIVTLPRNEEIINKLRINGGKI